MYFTSPTSNITPAYASVTMSRTDSRDSTCSGVFSSRSNTSAYASLTMSTSPAWLSSQPLMRSSSSSSSVIITHDTTTQARRESNSSTSSGSTTWARSPFRSCLETSCVGQASSYISDDDLLYVAPPSTLEIETVPSLQRPKQEMTTEEQIAMYRELQEKEQQQEAERKRVVRFASNNLLGSEKTRRSSSSNMKRRATIVRRSTHQYNGPQ